MTNKRAFIPPELAHELVKNIRLLALSGKKNFRQYLYDPLVYAGWERDKAHLAASTGKLMDKIQEDSADPAYQHAIALHCKRLISQGLTEGFSALGDSCIFFLDKMQEEPNLAASNEATEFVLAVEKPLKEFAKITSDTNEKKFEESVQNLSVDEMKSAFDPVRLDGTRKKVYLETELHTLYQQVLVATKSNNLAKCKNYYPVISLLITNLKIITNRKWRLCSSHWIKERTDSVKIYGIPLRLKFIIPLPVGLWKEMPKRRSLEFGNMHIYSKVIPTQNSIMK